MKGTICLLLLLLLTVNGAWAEETIILPDNVDLSAFDSFARERDADYYRELIDRLFSGGEFPDWREIAGILTGLLSEPFRKISSQFAGMLFPAIMLALMNAALPGRHASAGFLCHVMLAISGADIFAMILQSAEECLEITASFSDAAVPALIAVLTASGKTASAGLISPSAALTGNLIESVYRRWGLLLCASAGSIALAANLSETTPLNRIFRLLKRLFNWGSGLILTLFTTMIFLQGSAASVSDGLAVRTAKYAVDSVTPVIGSGISDAWESYLSGLNAARNAVGLSGCVLLLSVCLKPMFTMAVSMIALSVFSSFLEISGEKNAASCLDQLSGACQMALSLCGGAMAVWVILMGSVLSLSGGIL